MNQNTPISLYKNARDNKGDTTFINIVIEQITGSSDLKPKIEALRKTVSDIQRADETQLESLKKRRELQKKALPAVTWSGTFTTRKADQIKDYSGLICIDIDDLPNESVEATVRSLVDDVPYLTELKAKLKDDANVFLCFLSPSGNGLKVLFRVEGGAEDHKANFAALESYFKATYNVEIDPSGKDCSRLCFLSYDPDCWVNYKSAVFPSVSWLPKLIVEASKAPALTKAEVKVFQNTGNDLDSIKAFTDNKLYYGEGHRNDYVYLFACNCNRKGIDISECLTYVTGFASDLYAEDAKQVNDTVKSAYVHHTHETGKFAKQQRENRPAKSVASAAGGKFVEPTVSATKGEKPAVNDQEYIKFWSVTTDEKRTDDDGKPVQKYGLIYTALLAFLMEAGFFRLVLPNGYYQFIRFRNNVCEPVEIIKIKDYVLHWLRQKEFNPVLEMMLRGGKSYFTPHVLEGLKYKEISFGKDTATEAFFYFKNCVARVTSDGVTTHPYTDAQRAIWASSMIQRDFIPANLGLPLTPDGKAPASTFEQCEMAKYILLVSHNPNSTEEITDEEASQRFLSLCSSIGYMLHGYKPRVSRAIVAVDHKIPEDKTEQNGGTGKSIVGESFKYLKSTSVIDGREFKEDYPFRFEMVGVDTKVVVMQDCRYNLDFGSFFVPITNDFTFNRRHTGYITLPFADAPKWWFDTNFVFKGEGASFRRRMHVIEFDNFFDENNTPFDVFGHYLFQDWDDAQWNQFYNFYLYCVQLYLSEGLIDYPKSNYESRKMVSMTPAEFIDFIDAKDDNGVYRTKRNEWFEKKELLRLWTIEAKELNMQTTSPHLLTKWMTNYTKARPWSLLKDKTNGVEWWLLADENYKGSGKRSEKNAVISQQTLAL